MSNGCIDSLQDGSRLLRLFIHGDVSQPIHDAKLKLERKMSITAQEQPSVSANMNSFNTEKTFFDRRQNTIGVPPGVERRQFSNTYCELSDDSRELATAIDRYKLMHRRRFITYDEMLAVIQSLGYHK